ncbi:hypothetical protein L2E82_40137 [Cichorium intybus]|uniref:Uncharacterized protein n=1 Tax=Cichorium intybus TaxID=13427 RepID=A0ACB9AJY9_CICIN|nr:hypothetical protein L2E82_40137 [Cichorium intybus]
MDGSKLSCLHRGKLIHKAFRIRFLWSNFPYKRKRKPDVTSTSPLFKQKRRAEEIRAVLEVGGGNKPSSNGGDTWVATRPKSNKKNGDGYSGEDSESAKLRSRLNSAIIRENPNVKWNDVAGLQSAKQALQEAVILPVKFPQFFVG